MDSDSPKGSREIEIRKALKWLGAVGGSVIGLGTLAFAAGFLAQRAQYDFAQVPFVFIDYWAYAEIGVMAVVKSIFLFVGLPWVLVFIALLTITIILLLEVDWFRKIMLRSHWSFTFYLMILVVLALLIFQQLNIRQLRNEMVSGLNSQETDTVPAMWPFSLFVSTRPLPPKPGEIAYGGSSTEMWARIADDLDAGVGRGARYLEIRPRPQWAIVPRGTAKPDDRHVLGVSVPLDELDSARATSLYQAVVSAFVLALWGFLLAGAWQKRILAELGDVQAPGAEGRLNKVQGALFRLKEELWFATQWVLRPVCALLLVTSGVFLLPECYGVLAMPRIGQEYVEVISESISDDDAGAGNARQEREINEEEELHRALILLNRYSPDEPGQAQEVRAEWIHRVNALRKLSNPKAAEILEVMANASSATAPELSDIAQDAWTLVSAKTFATREGYILYYPRSETDYLRILQPNPLSHRKRWTIYPVKMSAIVEIRVKRDEQTIRLVNLLRGMGDLDPQERAEALYEAEKLGHSHLLEVAIAGSLDPSHHVRGFSITDIGRYASVLPDGRDSILRRNLANRRLLEIIRDRKERSDLRAAAATALHRFVADEEVCSSVMSILRQDANQLNDEYWTLRGSLITTVGKLRCKNALNPLLAMLLDERVPEVVRSSIPTQLITIGNQRNSAPALARLINDISTPAMILGPAITAISLLSGDDTSVAVRSLCEFLREPAYSPDLAKANLLTQYRVTALDSLRQLGNPSSADTLHFLAQRANEKSTEVRVKAIIALGELSLAPSEEVLLKIFEDREEEELVRFASLNSLAGFPDNRTIVRLGDLYATEAEDIQDAIIKALEERADHGSSLARITSRYLRQDEDEDEEELKAGSKVEAKQGQPEPPANLPPGGGTGEIPDEITEISIGDEITGRVEPDAKLSFYRFTIAVPGTYRIEVNAVDSADPVIVVAKAENVGEVLAQDDDGGGGSNSLIVMEFEAGEYLLAIGDYEGRGGAMKISISGGGAEGAIGR